MISAAIFEEYSQGRIQDTVNEFKSEFPQIERLLLNMKPSRKEIDKGEGYIYDTNKLKQKIKRFILLQKSTIYQMIKKWLENYIVEFGNALKKGLMFQDTMKYQLSISIKQKQLSAIYHLRIYYEF